MPDESGRSFLSAIPLPGLIAAITGVMGTILLQYEPLAIRHPSEISTPITLNTEPYQIDSTLYEDPLNLIAKAKLIQKENNSEPSKTTKFYHTLPGTSSPLVFLNSPSLLVIPVFMKPGADRVNSESRARTRLAVIEGLASSGYIPKNNKVECFLLPELNDGKGCTLHPAGLELPFEHFEGRPDIPQITPHENRHTVHTDVVVLWLPGEAMESTPISKLRSILSVLFFPNQESTNKQKSSAQVTALGPHSTGALVEMLREARMLRGTKLAPSIWPHDIELISYSATAPTEFILAEGSEIPTWKAAVPTGWEAEEKLASELSSSLGGKTFTRTIQTDDIIASALVKELESRGVKIKPHQGNPKRDTAHIAIISEFNTPYGRALPQFFLKAAEAPAETHYNNKSNWHWLNFPRGLDGRKAGAATSESSSPDKSKNDTANNKTYTPGEVPDGPNQADALRRMSEDLKQLDRRLIDKGEGGIRAIGLMGGDVFDKLWLLRALRPHFPQAIFFTDNLDAWLWQRDEIRSTRNLVVASPFGLSLSPELQMGKAPFRESYQTSAYASTLAATGAIDRQLLENRKTNDVRLYEVGSKAPHELDLERLSNSPREIHPPPEIRANSKRITRLLGILAAISLAALVYWSLPEIGKIYKWLGKPPRPVSGPGRLKETRKGIKAGISYYITHPFLWVIPIIWVSVMITHQLWKNLMKEGEPFHLSSGISAWPAQGFRIAAILLALHLTAHLLKTLKKNVRLLEREFFLKKKLPAFVGHSWFSRFWHWFSQVWFWCASAPKPGSHPVDPDLLWGKYRRYTGHKARLLRSFVIFLLLFSTLLGLEWLLGSSPPPIRGHETIRVNHRLDLLSTAAFLWITALVIDTMWSGRMFAHWMTSGTTQWKASKLLKYVKKGVSRPAACDYLDLQVIAIRTHAIVSFAFYPFYILALLILSRCEWFDHWLWPNSLIASYAIPIVLVLIAAQLLRSEAEGIRSTLLGLLKSGQGFPPSQNSPFSHLINEVKNLKSGALGPISEQPVMRGIYWLLSALSIGTLWQHLSQVF